MTQEDPVDRHAADDASSAPGTDPARPEGEGRERQWWEDPNLPFSGKPSRAEMWCWSAFALMGLYGVVLLPLRAVLLRLNDYVHVAITGSGLALIDIGAHLGTGGARYWWVGLLLASVSVMKFDWILWWAGRLWGHAFIETAGRRSRFARRWGPRLESWVGRYGSVLLVLVWFVPFVPSFIVQVGVGDAGMRLRRFLLLDWIGALGNRAIYLWLGYQIGAPAKDVVALIAKYSTYITIALVIVVVVRAQIANRRSA